MPGRKLKKWHKKIHCAIKLSALKKDDVVVCNGYSVFPFLDYVATLPCKKILILRDSVEALTTKRRKLGQLGPDQDYVETVRPIFDAILTFDPTDSLTYHLKYINQFLPFSWNNLTKESTTISKTTKKCFFVGGYQPIRVSVINSLTPVLADAGYATEFYLLDKDNLQQNYPDNCKNEKLSYTQNIEKIKQSDIILEINKPDQSGLTLRALEALALNRKLITNNMSIEKMDFYHPSRVFILTEQNLNEVGSFLNSLIVKAEDELVKRYCADSMLKTLQHIIEHSPDGK